jgi:hypothetical protein
MLSHGKFLHGAGHGDRNSIDGANLTPSLSRGFYLTVTPPSPSDHTTETFNCYSAFCFPNPIQGENMKLLKATSRVLPVFLGLAAFADRFGDAIHLTPVPAANTKTPGFAAPNILSPELIEVIAAQGSMKLEGASQSTSVIPYYGYSNDGPLLPAAGNLPSAQNKVEATKTEPDKNTYLVLRNQHGADVHYDYGNHFVFQGHEGGVQGSITRINLDADGAHRVTLMATTDVHGTPLPLIDGSTWYPFSQHLLFTSENSTTGGVWQATPDFPSQVESLQGIIGIASYEGIQADTNGNIIIVEDASGAKGTVNSHARQPNSFVFRFLPKHTSDLKQGGKLQVLQVMSRRHSGAIVFGSSPDSDIKSDDVKDLHTYGLQFLTKWVTIHDTDKDGTAPFNANALAKSNGGTPFKRPENGQFRPGTHFSEFIFAETGDTDINTEAGTTYGGFGSVMRLRLFGDGGLLSLVYRSDATHGSLDNCAFWSADEIIFVEDAGDGLHSDRNALDSAYLFNLNTDYSNPAHQPVRILAEGRDPSATLDSALGAFSGFNNEGDNEITGIHISDGDASIGGLLGAKIPTPFHRGWRFFWTQQHGDNITWEVLPTVDPDDD